MLPRRIDIIEQLRSQPNVEVVFSYAESDEFVQPVMDRLDAEFVGRRPAKKRNESDLYRCYLESQLSMLLVDSPFFGQGHVGYDGIEALASAIRGGI